MSRFSSRANLARTSSPQDDFATANSFTHDQLIHSTLNFEHTGKQSLPLGYDHFPDPDANDTAGSADMSMSIELGRGVKRSARDQDMDSSNMAIAFGGDSQYEITGTPPVRPRTASRKSDGLLRREASVRAANSAVKSKQRSISEAIGRRNREDEDTMQPTMTARNTRFTGARRVSAQDGTPRRAAANNPTVQSATYTANSFALPDMAGITELVSGVRADGTPILSRSTKPARSRFTSGSYQPARPEHVPVDSVPVPEDEHKIYTGLQRMKEQNAQRDLDLAEAERRADECEQEIIELRRQLEAERRRPDVMLDGDEGTASMNFQQQKSSLQASVNALEQHWNRAERKATIAQIKLQRAKTERNELVEELGLSIHRSEELEKENQQLREGYAGLVEENENLKEQLDEVRAQVNAKSAQLPQQVLPKRRNSEKQTAATRTAKQQAPESDATEDLSTKIARVVEKHRREAMADRSVAGGERQALRETSTQRSRSKSQSRQQAGSRRMPAAAAEETETTTEMEITQKTRNALGNMYMPSPAKKPQQPPTQPKVDEQRDFTLLSLQDPLEVANLRKKLEEEHMARKNRRNFSAPETAQQAHRDDTARSAARDVNRKSSLKDITAGLENITGRLSLHGDATEAAKKTVRVQSPQQTEDGDLSILSNISRRRRRAASEEGMTSAFILPDITFSANQLPDFNATKSCIHHSSASCTVCHPGDDKIEIPTPVPVTERPAPEDPDVTTATVRPAQPPPIALASVLKQLEDEVTHLKIQLAEHQRRYQVHDPALSRRQRLMTKSRIEALTKQIETRADQIYALYDVLEGQKQNAGKDKKEDVEDTLQSLGIDPADLAGRMGRKASVPLGLDGAYDEESSGDELPGWEGLSDGEGEEERV